MSYPISEQHREQEEQVIAHILHHSNYSPMSQKTWGKKQNTLDATQPIQKKWAKLTYSGKETRFITKILKKAGLHIAFTTRQTIAKLLAYNMNHLSDKYEESGVYKLTCLDFHKNYVGQTGRSFHTRFKERAQHFRLGNHRSNFAKHLFDCQHTLHLIEDSMSILCVSSKGQMINTLERYI
jgi:hypothetical protein